MIQRTNRQDHAYSGHMSTTLNRLGALNAAAMKHSGVSKERMCAALRISRETLRRRLKRGNFLDVELYRAATLLHTRPSRLMARAEQDQS